MSKRLKRFLFIIIGVFVAAGLGVGGYFLIGNLSAVTINDLRILAFDGKEMKNTEKYLIDETHNQFDIIVDIDSTGSTAARVTSSNPDVATVEKNGEVFTVKYFGVGKTTITAYSALTTAVSDSFVLTVSEDFVADVVIDEKTDNVLTVFANGKTNAFDYVATGVLADDTSNNALLRVVDDYDKNVIRSVRLDQPSKKIYISTNIAKEDSSQMINLQSYYVDENGEEHIIKNFVYTLEVIGYKIKEIQLLVSQDHHFGGRTDVYLDSLANKDNTPENREAHYIAEDENLIQDIYLTGTINIIYFKTRVLYTDGTMEYTNADHSTLSTDKLDDEGRPQEYKYVKPQKITSTYLVANVIVSSLDTFDDAKDEYLQINFQVDKTAFDKTITIDASCKFNIKIMKANQPAYTSFTNNKLYKLVDDKYYEYVYWDTRYMRTDAITDAEGRIIGFSGGNPVYD